MRTRTVVVIHSEEATRKILVFALEQRSIHAVPAVDGYEGIVRVESHRPDAVILSSDLPDPEGTRDGFFVTQYIREHPELQKIPVIMLSTKGRAPEFIHRALEERVTAIYPEPFISNTHLVETVESFFASTPQGV